MKVGDLVITKSDSGPGIWSDGRPIVPRGEGSIGIVTAHYGDWIEVTWDDGEVEAYDFGEDEAEDLMEEWRVFK